MLQEAEVGQVFKDKIEAGLRCFKAVILGYSDAVRHQLQVE